MFCIKNAFGFDFEGSKTFYKLKLTKRSVRVTKIPLSKYNAERGAKGQLKITFKQKKVKQKKLRIVVIKANTSVRL